MDERPTERCIYVFRDTRWLAHRVDFEADLGDAVGRREDESGTKPASPSSRMAAAHLNLGS